MRTPARLLAAIAIAAPLYAAAQVSVNINLPGIVTVAPPAPRYERVPPPRGGYVWVPGRWQWVDSAYAWRGGYWERARPDYAYVPGRWVRADGGWRWVEGDWKHARKAQRRYEREQERYERHYDDDRHGHGHGGHCPPGQAKKGRC